MYWDRKLDTQIADLDPLGADTAMGDVPRFNERRNVDQLVVLIKTFCQRANLESRTYGEVLAIVRDIGIVAGSIQRHGFDPVSLAPELELVLLSAAKLTDLPARDTLMHYTLWNPTGVRLRTYTNHDQEPALIQSIRISLPAICEATRDLARMRRVSLSSAQAIQIGSAIADELKAFLAGLDHARRHVAPEVFINCFRPFFEPFVVGNALLRGPGAVTMPLHVFDYLLWGSSEPNQAYQLFTSDYVPYDLSEFRDYYLRSRNVPSFLDRLESELHSGTQVSNLAPLLSVVGKWFRLLYGFRGSHLTYSTKAYHGNTVHNFKSGSGGHTTSDLQLIASLTQKHAKRIGSFAESKDGTICSH